jgi:hypothetical protein
MNRAAAARPSGADAEPEPWERAAFQAAVHSDPIELAGATMLRFKPRQPGPGPQ